MSSNSIIVDIHDKPLLDRSKSVENSINLLNKYLSRVTVKANAHKRAEQWYSSMNRILGFPPVILSTLVSVLGGIEYSKSDQRLSLTVVSLSGVCALMTGSLSYLNFSKRASQHHDSSAHYADVQSDIEIFLNTEYTVDELSNFLNVQHEKIDIYETLEPNLHESFIQKSSK